MGFLDDLSGPEGAPDTFDSRTGGLTAPAPKSGGFLDSLTSESEGPHEKPPAPSWSEIPSRALSNAPESAWNFGKNLIHPITHPKETAEGIGNLGLGVMEKLGLYGSSAHEKYPEAAWDFIKDRYGSIDNAKRTLAEDPVGVAGDLSMILSGGGAGLRAAGLEGKVSNALTTAGHLSNPLTPVDASIKLAGKGAAALAGYDTGTGMRNIEEAARAGYEGSEAGKTFLANQSGRVTGEEFVREAHSALKNMLEDRGRQYVAGMGGVNQNNQILNWNKVGQAIQDAHNVQSFHGQGLLTKRGEKMRGELDNMVIDWMQLPPQQFHTPAGFDALKKKLSNVVDETEYGSPERVIANKYYGAVKQTIIDQVPEYAKVMEGYSKASDLVKQIEKTLSLPANERKLNIDTALRKLQSTLRTNVNTNFGQRENLLKFLEASGSPNLRSAIAGQALKSVEAHGLVRLIPALASMSLPDMAQAIKSLGITSPHLMGKIAYGTGAAARYTGMKHAQEFMPKNTPMALQQIGRITSPQETGFNRGGRIARALRATKRLNNG